MSRTLTLALFTEGGSGVKIKSTVNEVMFQLDKLEWFKADDLLTGTVVHLRTSSVISIREVEE